ncbi:MAG: hypothetical protein E6J40_07015 [Chloroflexi bacterium]|nr:MAG: hypothetical protein E6J40_07015 [Chloroflexota bacterium]
MSSTWFYRIPALIGLIFPIFGFVKGGGDDSAPTNASSGQQIAVYVFHHGIPNLNSLVHIELWAFLSVLIFTLVLYSRLRPAEPKVAVAAQVAVAACVVSIAVKLGSFPATYALYSSPVQLDPGLARTLWVIGDFAFTVSMLVQALSIGAIAASGLIYGGIPRWLAGTAGVIAVAMVPAFILGGNFVVAPTLAWFLWLAAASVTLFVQGPRVVSEMHPSARATAAGAA